MKTAQKYSEAIGYSLGVAVWKGEPLCSWSCCGYNETGQLPELYMDTSVKELVQAERDVWEGKVVDIEI